jgi:ABC-type Mn2+/Zn2+ transport system ATPase subunit
VVGANGSGKSTLMKLLGGLEPPDSGEVTRRRGAVVAYLEQHPQGDVRTALDTVLAARPDLVQLEHELGAVAEQLGDPSLADDLDRMTRVLRRQEQLLERWEGSGGPSVDGRAPATLLELGLSNDELLLPTKAPSGGQRKLVALAACLEQRPDVLLLDEPEAHLDNAGRARVEELARRFEGAIAAVSHDRYLLDEIVSTIAVGILGSGQAHIRQANNKQRQIDRMDGIDRPVLERREIALQLRPSTRGGQRVFELRSLGPAFGEHPIIAGANLTVVHGERVRVVEENGAGKSVLRVARAPRADRRRPLTAPPLHAVPARAPGAPRTLPGVARNDVTRRIRSLDQAEPLEQRTLLCFLAGQTVTLDESELNAALRRSALLLAAGGDPRRGLDPCGRAVTGLAADLDTPAARAELMAGLASLAAAAEGLQDAGEALRLLQRDPDLAWRCFALGLLAEELAGDGAD